QRKRSQPSEPRCRTTPRGSAYIPLSGMQEGCGLMCRGRAVAALQAMAEWPRPRYARAAGQLPTARRCASGRECARPAIRLLMRDPGPGGIRSSAVEYAATTAEVEANTEARTWWKTAGQDQNPFS